ncbi:MAG: tetratricopeptide repeat protein [Chloroflexi bacterium]|nr:tetratricopeptide repeat protein [Chloroflexota bacterium]
MKAFLSHSSVDKDFVVQVYDALEPESLWLDRAELEWGNIFLEKIEAGIKAATDFVLFWSRHSAKSPWVDVELNMAFMELVLRRAIRLRIVRLDTTELPLRLEPYHHLSVVNSQNPVADVVAALREALAQPTQGVRNRFLNRNAELGRVEDMILDSETKAIILRGFQGIGKGALAKEALRRFFEGASVVDVEVSRGIGPVEIALQLHHEVSGALLPEMTQTEALAAIELSVRSIVSRGQFLIFRNVQHWLDGEGALEEPLPTIIRQSAALSETVQRPIFITSTRFPRIPPDLLKPVSPLRVEGLEESHVASLLAMWLDLSTGSTPDRVKLSEVASQLHGHPLAAKLASNLVEQFGVEYLLEYPREMVTLRRDLAKTMIGDLSLKQVTYDLMELLAVVGVPVLSGVVVEALRTDPDHFHEAVSEATAAGIVETTDSGHLTLHPLFSEHFWRTHLDHGDYRERASIAAEAVNRYFSGLSKNSGSYVPLLRAIFRLYALSNRLEEAFKIRRDLTGELAQAAITHYNRRQFALAESFINELLEVDSQNWRMRLYLARIRIRQRRWQEADRLIADLLHERPRDTGALHASGWRLLREDRYEEALDIFTRVLAVRNDHSASFRDAADCLYRLNRIPEALELLQRAKGIESDNPFILDLEARIYQEEGEYEKALRAANLAVVRNPRSWSLRRRLAQILSALGRKDVAVDEAREAVSLNPEDFTAQHTLVSLLLDAGRQDNAMPHVRSLEKLAINGHQRQIAAHSLAHAFYLSGDLSKAIDILESQIHRRANLAANYGLLAQIRLAEHSFIGDHSLASAQILLQQAKTAVANCEAQSDHDTEIVRELKNRIERLETGISQ